MKGLSPLIHDAPFCGLLGKRILILMRWLIAAVILLALCVVYLVQKTRELESASKPAIHLIATNSR